MNNNPPSAGHIRVAFLDRDGTVNVDHGYVVSRSVFQLTEGCATAIRILQDCGFSIAVVTNQSAVSRGYCSTADIEAVNRFMRRQLKADGVTIDAIAYCPHDRRADCSCRKPRTGLAQEVERQLGRPIDYGQSWMIGDKASDVHFGQSLGMRTVLICSRYWSADDLCCEPDYFAGSILQAAGIVNHAKTRRSS